MRKPLLVIVLCMFCPISFSQLKIFSFEAKQHIGDSVRVDGITVFTEYKAKEKRTYVYFGRKAPQQDLAVIVPDADLHNFPHPIKILFTNKISVVIGKIVMVNKKPAIIAHSFNEFAPGPGQ
jgi:hypothetical protein